MPDLLTRAFYRKDWKKFSAESSLMPPSPPLPRSLPVKGLTKTDIILMVIEMEMNDVTDGQYSAQDGGDSKGCGGGQLGVWLCLWAGLGNKVKEENACVADFY